MILTDVYEVAFLSVTGQKFRETMLVDGKVRFEFDDSVKLDLRKFYEGKMTVDALAYKHAIQDVRNIIFGMKKAPSTFAEGGIT